MDYYGRNDITLGGFLERYCFRESYTCPSKTCDVPMSEHIRRFVHEQGSLLVVLKRLEKPMPAYQDNILMWEWCRKCKEVRLGVTNFVNGFKEANWMDSGLPLEL